jgi:DNA repair protein RadA/Sms
MTFDGRVGERTQLLHHLEEMAQERRPALIIVDNAADTFGGKEVDRHETNQFLKVALGGLASKTGAGVLLLAHPSVAGMDSRGGASGSTAWSNGVRSRLYMVRPPEDADDFDPDVRVLSVVKANYGKLGDGIRVLWKKGAFVLDGVSDGGMVARLDAKQKAGIVLAEMTRIIAGGERLSPNSKAGNYAPRRLLKTEAIRNAKMTRVEIERHIDRLQRDDAVKAEEYKNNGRLCECYVITKSDDDQAADRILN